jgi:hypothetical protein
MDKAAFSTPARAMIAKAADVRGRIVLERPELSAGEIHVSIYGDLMLKGL